jgi:hypothetical protein
MKNADGIFHILWWGHTAGTDANFAKILQKQGLLRWVEH